MDFLQWLAALWKYWWALMGCAVFTILGAYVLAFKKSEAWALWATFGAAVVMLLVASFLGWRDEHSKFLELSEKLKTPDLRLEEDASQIWFGTRADKRFVIMMGGALTNPHGPPSAAAGWSMQLQFSDHLINGEIPLPSGKDISLPLSGRPNQHIILPEKNFWPNKTEAPIEAGGLASGWIMALFRDVSEDDIFTKKPTLVVSCIDVVSKQRHFLRRKLGDEPRGIRIPGE